MMHILEIKAIQIQNHGVIIIINFDEKWMNQNGEMGYQTLID